MHRLPISRPCQWLRYSPSVALPSSRGIFFGWGSPSGWTVVDKAIDACTGTSMDDARVELFPPVSLRAAGAPSLDPWKAVTGSCPGNAINFFTVHGRRPCIKIDFLYGGT